jgi:hypothetical protein
VQHSLGTVMLVFSLIVLVLLCTVCEAVYQELQHHLGTVVVVFSLIVLCTLVYCR